MCVIRDGTSVDDCFRTRWSLKNSGYSPDSWFKSLSEIDDKTHWHLLFHSLSFTSHSLNSPVKRIGCRPIHLTPIQHSHTHKHRRDSYEYHLHTDWPSGRSSLTQVFYHDSDRRAPVHHRPHTHIKKRVMWTKTHAFTSCTSKGKIFKSKTDVVYINQELMCLTYWSNGVVMTVCDDSREAEY